MTAPRRPIEERFWAKVDKSGECWLWTAGRNTPGYGVISEGGHSGKQLSTHRVAYELEVGPIPNGLTIDHLCHNADLTCPGGNTCPHRACVRPDHLEAVLNRINILRGRAPVALQAQKIACPQGHAYDESNTYAWRGHRRCRQCNAEVARRLRRVSA